MKKLMFVHVPKTSGTSILNHFMPQLSCVIPYIRHFNTHPLLTNVTHDQYFYTNNEYSTHDPIFILQKYNNLDDYHIFSVVRNPFTRAYSLYKELVVMGYKRFNIKFETFEQVLEFIRTKNHPIASNILGYQSTASTYLVFNQSFFLYDSKGKLRIDKLYSFENLNELEQDFQIQLPKLRFSNYTKDDYYNAYNQTNIDLVKHIYLEDFINFNYSMEFVWPKNTYTLIST